jgi:dTDP-glucose pyrophosphorylase
MINTMANNMINIVIPMAGAGSRFKEAGYKTPKPFINVAGKPMIVHVLENLNLPNANFILVAQRDHANTEADLFDYIKEKFNAKFVLIDSMTEGASCSILHARRFISNDKPLLIGNSDQLVDFDLLEFIQDSEKRNLDGSMIIFKDKKRDTKWSFVRTNMEGLAELVVEKEPISDLATVGIYFFKHGFDFVDAAIEMILNRKKVNGEYYIAPTYNFLIEQKKKIGIFEIDPKLMHGLGTPDDLNAYLKLINDNIN